MSLLNPNLQAFMAIVQNGTVHGAALLLGLTQTGVTQRIRSLEKELSTTLFLRSRKGMHPTDEGLALLRYCQQAIELEGETLSKLHQRGIQDEIEMTITGPTSIMTSRISEQCYKLYHDWPYLLFHFLVSDFEDRLSLVRSGKVAMAIVAPELVPNEMDSKLLRPEKFILVASKSWKGRRLSDIFLNERLIDFHVNDSTSIRYCKKFELPVENLKSRLFVNNNEILIKYVLQGVGFATLTLEVAKPFLDSGELIVLNRGEVLEDKQALVWYPRTEMPNYFKSIINSIK